MRKNKTSIILLAVICLTGFALVVAHPAVMITSWYPNESNITDLEGAERTFNVTINQPVNVSWQINGTKIFNQSGVNFSEYTNTSAVPGYWNVTAHAHNENGSDMRTWWWTVTGDTTPPAVISYTPTGTKVSIKTNITATFSEKMNCSTLNNATIFVCNSSGSSVTGAITYENTTVTFDPVVSELEYNETYNVTITTGVQDLAGNNMSSDVCWNFTTRSEILRVPIVISGDVTKNGTWLLNPVVTITNLDTGENFTTVKTHPNSSYYRMQTDSTHISAGDTLRFNVSDGEIVVDLNVNETEIDNGGFRQDLPDMPDLIITNITPGDVVNETFNITFTVENIGSKDASESNASTYIEYADGISMKSYSIKPLAPGEYKTITVDNISCPCRDIKICADSENTVAEFDETNNCMKTTSTCKLPDLKARDYIREDILQPNYEFIEIIDEANGRYKIYYAIENWHNDAGPSNATLYINMTSVNASINSSFNKTFPVPALGRLKHNIFCSGPFTCSPSTNVNVKVCADSDQEILESDENNNCMEESFNCTAIDKPDLKIVNTSVTWDDFVNKTFIVDYTVENIGHKPAKASTTVIKIDGVEATTDQVPALAPGESYTNSTVGPFNLGGSLRLNITICADANKEIDERIDESNEDNNCRNISIGQALIDIYIKDRTWIPPALNKTYTVSFWVTNNGGVASGACNVYAYIDGSDNASATCAIASVPAPVPGRNAITKSIGPFTMTGKNDTIKLCIEWEGGNKSCTDPTWPISTFRYEGCLADDGSALYSCSGDRLVKKSCTFLGDTYCDYEHTGKYYGGSGLVIGADNITIDGNGYAIVGDRSKCKGYEWDDCQLRGISYLGIHYDNVTIKNLGVSSFCNGIAIRGVNNYRIENCSVHDNGPSGDTDKYTYGINVENSSHIMIDNCSAYNNTGILTGMNVAGGHGINFDDGSSYCEVTNSRIFHNYFSGILASPTCKYLYIGNNLIEDNGYCNESGFCAGVNLHWKGGFGLTTNSTVENNTILNNTGSGIYVTQGYTTIKDNLVKGSKNGKNVSGNGIRIHDGKVTFLYNNTCCDNEGIDIIDKGFATFGDDNTCDTTSNYDDEGTQGRGCNFYCNGVNGVCIGDATKTVFRCGDVVTESCTFNRSMSCQGCASDGLIVGADGITIDGAGYALTGSYSGIGVISNQSSVTIKNLQVEDFSIGMEIENASRNLIENCTVRTNLRTGINLSADNGTIRNSRIYDNVGPGIFVDGANNTFENNIVAKNRNGTLRNNSGYGIYFSQDAGNNTLIENAVGNNEGMEIYNDNGGSNTGDNNTCDIAFNYWDLSMFKDKKYNCTHAWTTPDLVISNKSEYWVDTDAKTYKIKYTVENGGEPKSRKAGSSVTNLSIDRHEVERADDWVSSLNASESKTKIFNYTARVSGQSDEIKVCADSDNEVIENNPANIFYYKDNEWYSVEELFEDKEANNCLENEFSKEGSSEITIDPDAACVANDGTEYRCDDPVMNTVMKSCTFNGNMGCPTGHNLIIGKRGITIDGAGYALVGTGSASCAYVTEADPAGEDGDCGILNMGCDGVTIKDLTIVNFCNGIGLKNVKNNRIESCNIYNNGNPTDGGSHGIHMANVESSTIKNCRIHDNTGTGSGCSDGGNGIFMYHCLQNKNIIGNDIYVIAQYPVVLNSCDRKLY